jgi:hypothetical protein
MFSYRAFKNVPVLVATGVLGAAIAVISTSGKRSTELFTPSRREPPPRDGWRKGWRLGPRPVGW